MITGQPRLTRLERLQRYGYWTEENVLGDDQLARLSAAMDRLLREGEAEWRRPHQDYFPNIIEFDDAFAELLDHPVLLEAALEVIGPDVRIYSNEVLVSKPTGEAMGWHRDKMSIGRHCPDRFVKMVLYLDPVTIDGGPTGVIPESHFDIYKGPEFFPLKIDYLAKPGSLLGFGAATLHRAGLHAAGQPDRPAIFFTFIPGWIALPGYYTGNRCQHLIETACPMRRQLLGVEQRPGIAMDSFSTQG